jgi:abortive infection bacteriophage resistance protein
MKYVKPALTFSDQADRLLKRGLVAPDQQAVIEKLQAVSYYRLSAYWYPFRQPDDTLKPGTTLETIWRRYTFDRQLRLLVLDAIERVEIAVRTQIVNRHTLKHGPFPIFICRERRWAGRGGGPTRALVPALLTS